MPADQQKGGDMRLRVHVSTRAKEIPWDQVIAPGRAIVYAALTRQAPQLGAKVHETGWGPHRMAPFGHSAPVFPKPVRARGTYVAGGTGTLEFGSPVEDIVEALAKDFAMIPILDWGGVALNIEGVTRVEPPAFASGRARFRTANPITVQSEALRSPDGQRIRRTWLLPGESGFDVALGHSLRRKAETFGHGTVTLEAITWIGPQRSFSVVGHGGDASGTVHRGKKTGAPVEIDVSGAPAALQALWSAGIGGATSAGFGWVLP
ncbi:CRISPR-associated endoribonuclease Cas6 [Streptomyces malaysiensis]|uniref:CRISPR-associated endoribonuclease Cas6 n=1 Tax=Streptomyces malaysiensis TaxID=92644 RepID=UPI0018D51839|nr:CRISPR-associated endoribonuclease Cas6 [Streptomyces sp. M56]